MSFFVRRELWLPETRYMLRRLSLQAIPRARLIVLVVVSLVQSLRFLLRSRASLHLEILDFATSGRLRIVPAVHAFV